MSAYYARNKDFIVKRFLFFNTRTLIIPQGCFGFYGYVWGAGSGGSFVNTNFTGTAGAGGGLAEGYFAVKPGQSITCTVGAAGYTNSTVNTAGISGGTSSIGSFMSATGGEGGKVASGYAPGLFAQGGQGIGGLFNYKGGNGLATLPNTMNFGASGGGSAPVPGRNGNACVPPQFRTGSGGGGIGSVGFCGSYSQQGGGGGGSGIVLNPILTNSGGPDIFGNYLLQGVANTFGPNGQRPMDRSVSNLLDYFDPYKVSGQGGMAGPYSYQNSTRWESGNGGPGGGGGGSSQDTSSGQAGPPGNGGIFGGGGGAAWFASTEAGLAGGFGGLAAGSGGSLASGTNNANSILTRPAPYGGPGFIIMDLYLGGFR